MNEPAMLLHIIQYFSNTVFSPEHHKNDKKAGNFHRLNLKASKVDGNLLW
jgi:hypothetical protein